MPNQPNVDGYVELRFNSDRTQVLADIYPPRGLGKMVETREIMRRISTMGVTHGLREEDIEDAVRSVTDLLQPVVRVVVAQGVLRVDGRDAQVTWKVDEELVKKPLPRRPNGQPDYFAYDPERRIDAGQVLATVVPGDRGSPGQTLTHPIATVVQRAGKEAGIIVGEGIHASDDRLRFTSEVAGFAELRHDKLSVHALDVRDADIDGGTQTFTAGIICMGSVTGATFTVDGPLAVRGIAAACSFRVRGDVHLVQASGCKIVADGNIYVLGELRDCDVMTPGRVIAEGAAPIIGGHISAAEGVDAYDIGDEGATPTAVAVGADPFGALRLKEVEEEIKGCEVNVTRIFAALKTMPGGGAEPITDEKRRLRDRLVEQRRNLEVRLRELLHEKRTLSAVVRGREASITVRGTAHNGVWLMVGREERKLDGIASHAVFVLTPEGSIKRNDLKVPAKAA